MKKILCIILSAIMLFTFTVPLLAEDDAPVNYVIGLQATPPKNGEAYEKGETVTFTVNVENIAGADNPKIYGICGIFNYDAFLLEFTGVKFNKALSDTMYQNDAAGDRFTFSYLCPTEGGELAGATLAASFVLAEISFVAQNDGTARITLSDTVITNKDATPRYISSGNPSVEIVTGSGQLDSNADTLARLINKAQRELDSAVIGSATGLVYPAFAVRENVYEALKAAIENARSVLASAVTEDFLEAERELNAALYTFNVSKLYGREPNDDLAGIIGGLLGELGKNDKPAASADFIEVTASAGEHGSIEAGYESQLVRSGTSASVKAVPDEGYEVARVLVNGEEYPANSIITIASVTHKTFVEFTFAKKPHFTDVAKDAWYYDAVEAITEMGLFTGTSETTFSPDTDMSRAMLVTVLHRLDGKPSVDTAPAFKDVEAGQWYTDAVAWASANGIVNGYTDGTFGTGDSATRQDMVTILYRYYKYKGILPASEADISAYTDTAEISDYALPAMKWACGLGLIKGTSDTTLSPKANSSRAQVATVILRCTQNIAK